MPEYYGKINVKSICSSNKYFSAIYGDGSGKSNDLTIARGLNSKLPDLVGQANFYTYDLESRK